MQTSGSVSAVRAAVLGICCFVGVVRIAAAQVTAPPTTPPTAPAQGASPTTAAQGAAVAVPTGPAAFEKEIAAFEAKDKTMFPTAGGNLFVGSSSIRLWKLEQSFPKHTCLNRGFGGSQMHEVNHFFDRIVKPYNPAFIVLYAGDNDLAKKRSVDLVVSDYEEFVKRTRALWPDVPIVFLGIKPSPQRWALRDKAQEVNQRVAKLAAAGHKQLIVDAWSEFLGENGEPREEFYMPDKLHLSPTGYVIWAKHLSLMLVQPAK
jgi:lysophospholipase L1-like esterase